MNTTLNAPVRRSNTDIDLTRFDSVVQSETPDRPKIDSIPDGRYEVRIEDAELSVSPRSGNPVLKYTLRVTGPSFANRVMWKHRGITANTVQYVMDELKVCGLQLKRFSDLGEFLHEIIGAEIEITRKTRGEDVNIYFNRQLDGGSANESDEDDLPF